MEEITLVGCDLHAKKGVVKVAVGRGPAQRWEFQNRRAGRAVLIAKLRGLAEREGTRRIVVAYEASGCGYQLHDELEEAGMECYVLAGNTLAAVHVPDLQTRDDQELARTRQDVRRKLSQVKGQIMALVHRQGAERPSEAGRGWTKKYRAWLQQRAGEGATGAQKALGSLLRQLRNLEEELGYLDGEVGELGQAERYAKQVQALTTKLAGVGALSALLFLVEMGELGRFRNRRQVGSYLGLAPSSNESGEADDRKGHITRQGSARLRQVLCQCAWTRARTDPREAALAERLRRKNPKKRKIALVALMRRLGIAMWHTAKSA